jgi:hypothetical protein
MAAALTDPDLKVSCTAKIYSDAELNEEERQRFARLAVVPLRLGIAAWHVAGNEKPVWMQAAWHSSHSLGSAGLLRRHAAALRTMAGCSPDPERRRMAGKVLAAVKKSKNEEK